MLGIVETDSGRALYLVGFYADATYPRVILDQPGHAYHARLLSASLCLAQLLWKESPSLLIEPEIGLRNGAPALPDYRCIGHFRSEEPLRPGAERSALTLIWFQQESPATALNLQVTEADWLRFALEY